MSADTTTAHIVETGESAFAVSIDVPGHHLIGDEPVAQGGADHAKGGGEGASAKTDHCTKTIRVIGQDLSEEQRKKLISVAARCPVQRTVEGTPDITTVAAS